MYDYFLGGKDHFAADREAADQILAVAPESRDNARANRAFLGRAVRYLAGQAGIRQFLDIGTGIPTAGNTHEVAQAIAPQSRVVYVDNDPGVIAHARALLVGTPQGRCEYVPADLRDPGAVLAGAARLLDFTQPVALLLVAVLHFIPDDDDPRGLVAAYLDALPPGSHLVLSHATDSHHPAKVTSTAAKVYDAGPASLALRPRDAVGRFFDGLTLVPPGLVKATEWRPDSKAEASLEGIGIYAGAGRKG